MHERQTPSPFDDREPIDPTKIPYGSMGVSMIDGVWYATVVLDNGQGEISFRIASPQVACEIHSMMEWVLEEDPCPECAAQDVCRAAGEHVTTEQHDIEDCVVTALSKEE